MKPPSRNAPVWRTLRRYACHRPRPILPPGQRRSDWRKARRHRASRAQPPPPSCERVYKAKLSRKRAQLAGMITHEGASVMMSLPRVVMVSAALQIITFGSGDRPALRPRLMVSASNTNRMGSATTVAVTANTPPVILAAASNRPVRFRPSAAEARMPVFRTTGRTSSATTFRRAARCAWLGRFRFVSGLHDDALRHAAI
jgi:hypothetical protein